MEFKEDILNLSHICEEELKDIFQKIEKQCFYNSRKVLDAFHKNNVSEADFNSTTGYGYGDIGRDTIEKVYSEVLETEDAIVRSQFISGTHALTVALFAFLRPGDIFLSVIISIIAPNIIRKLNKLGIINGILD